MHKNKLINFYSISFHCDKIKNIGKFQTSPSSMDRKSKKQKMERNVTITMMLIVCEFLMAWTPYA